MEKVDPIDEETKKLLGKSEISLSLDTYDDIFSDFDPRPFSERALSDDFLLEAKKASRDKVTGIELNFLIPKDKRSMHEENIIKGRLREHFRKHYHLLHQEYHDLIKKGMWFVLVGIVFMAIATYILLVYPQTNFVYAFLVVLLEPAGWFTFWEGMSMVIFKSKDKKPDLGFYSKMSNCEINFLNY